MKVGWHRMTQMTGHTHITRTHTHTVNCFPRSRVDHWLTLVPWCYPPDLHTHTPKQGFCTVFTHKLPVRPWNRCLLALLCHSSSWSSNLQGAQNWQRCPVFLLLTSLCVHRHTVNPSRPKTLNSTVFMYRDSAAGVLQCNEHKYTNTQTHTHTS